MRCDMACRSVRYANIVWWIVATRFRYRLSESASATWKDAREAGLEFRNQRVFQRFLFADVFQLVAKKRKEHVLPEQVCAIFAVAFRNDLAERLRTPDPATETDEVREVFGPERFHRSAHFAQRSIEFPAD